MAPAEAFAARTTHPLAPTEMYKTTSLGVVGPAPTYVAMSIYPLATAPVYLATAPQAVGPSGMSDSLLEPLDGGGGNFGSALKSSAEPKWPGMTTRDVLNAHPKLYEEYRKVFPLCRRGCLLAHRL